MLKFAIVSQNPLGAAAVMWTGVAFLVLIAVMVAAVWFIVATGRARRDIKDFDDSANDPALDALRHERLVVRETPAQRQAVVSELAPDPTEDQPADAPADAG